MERAAGQAPFVLTAKSARHPLLCRAHSTDIAVFRQIFVQRDYACLDPLREAALVVDCGANVGYSSAYFLSRFPRADLVAVEPDAGNFALLERNLAPYGPAVRTLRAAVWPHPASLVMAEGAYRGGGEWARQVRERREGDGPGFPGVDVGGLLAASGHERISLLKVDIEGAEGVVFGPGCAAWLDRVDNLVIELHDDSSFGDCSAIFGAAIAGAGFAVSQHGELTLCRRLRA